MPRPSLLPFCVTFAFLIGTDLQASAPPKPVYGWKVLSDSTYELQALDTRRFSIPSTGKLRVSVRADSGVFGGVMLANRVPKVPREPLFKQTECSLIGVIEGETTCDLNHRSTLVYVIRDKRSELALAGGFVGLKGGMVRPMEHATAGNRAHIVISQWACTANCGHVPD
jgi:hypothetical protein